jgi:hypothetical protein
MALVVVVHSRHGGECNSKRVGEVNKFSYLLLQHGGPIFVSRVEFCYLGFVPEKSKKGIWVDQKTNIGERKVLERLN